MADAAVHHAPVNETENALGHDFTAESPDAPATVANIIAGGIGLNLTAARQVVFNDLDWVPANHWQAEDRAYRIGQTGTVNVTYFSAAGTVDEFVSHALMVKSALIETVVESGEWGVESGEWGAAGELDTLIGSLSLPIASLRDEESGEDPVDRLLREAVAAMGARDGVAQREVVAREAVRQLPAEAIR